MDYNLTDEQKAKLYLALVSKYGLDNSVAPDLSDPVSIDEAPGYFAPMVTEDEEGMMGIMDEIASMPEYGAIEDEMFGLDDEE